MENKNINELLKFVGKDNIYWQPFNEWGSWKFKVLVPFSKLQKFVDICNELFEFNGAVPANIYGNCIYVDLRDYAIDYYDELEKILLK